MEKLLLWRLKLELKKCLSVNIYAPNTKQENFCKKLHQKLNEWEDSDVYILGNFNVVFDQKLDRKSTKRSRRRRRKREKWFPKYSLK